MMCTAFGKSDNNDYYSIIILIFLTVLFRAIPFEILSGAEWIPKIKICGEIPEKICVWGSSG